MWNAGVTIRDTLESVLSQTYPNIEHIIVDGGSTDNTMSLIREYESRHNGRMLYGNHNYKRQTFDLIVKPIVIKDGAWVGAQSTVCPGVTMHSHSVLSVGSIASKDLMPYSIYRGNPAVKVAELVMSES